MTKQWLRTGVAVTAVATAAGAGLTAAHPRWPGEPDPPHGPQARNVILIQGDGMGLSHRELFRLALVGHEGELAMDSMPHSGWVHTDPADPTEPVTDSAAAATAFASGVKTYNGAVGVDAEGNPVETLLELARRNGKSTGLVTTSQVTDATPAAFGAHVTDRSAQSAIALQYLTSSMPDVVLGGGEDWWYPAGDPGEWPDNPPTDSTEQSKGTEGNLVERAQQAGYTYAATREELAAATGPRLLGLFANEEMFEHRNEGEGAVYDPAVPLPEMAAKALDVLSEDRRGFFLLIEEEGIDEMAHHSNAHLLIEAGRALDETVALAREFAAEHPRTLVLVVGDHETGGLAIENVDPDDESGDGEEAEDGPFTVAGTDLEFTVDWTTGGHTGAATPITAEGPGAERLGVVQQNTDVHDAVVRAMIGNRRPR
ncbi:alkaline phosphatase [Georgenia sp. TF02-10]|uniref:alkaline phosphatase n=1 Tax=Georgenia sp. TF02-10 TaxID=2917725 RepID=UPI001FA76670|nr:alkaline phosphatase [Georgenia sp. TF02-10]UNX55395.1 alkaline phosphatase [Georgenia sp. TF02-10]